ncbi:MAG TPA: hypothetical protein VF622_11480 [Segetibacter sp.]|jgi:hypothetical protein
MKKIIILSLLFISHFGVQAQKHPTGFHVDKPIDMVAVLAPKPSLGMSFSSVSEARTIITDIMDAVNIQQNFTIASTAQIENAAAVVFQNQRYILYNPSFINRLDKVANDKWASISVLAHEIGHHLLGHTLDGRGSQLPKELAADEFSGLVLRRMGASLQQSQLAMQLISSPYASTTHPGQKDRLAAISKGWYSTTTQTSNNNKDIAIEYPRDDRRTTTTPAPRYPSGNTSRTYPQNDRRTAYPQQGGVQQPRERTTPPSYPQRGSTSNQTIVYDVKFNSANGAQYFITSQNNVIKYSGNRLQVVAKIAASNKTNFPYVIYDDRVQMYVDRRGNIYSENGRSVGYITRHA